MPRRKLRRIALPCAALALLFHPGLAVARDLVFSGALQRIGSESISIQLADRRLIDARLPKSSPFAYQLGDQIEITCKTIPPVWEEDTSRYQSLEVTRLRFLHAQSTEDSIPPPRVTEAPHQSNDALDHAREVNLDYAANMPNFVADETAKRYSSGGASQPWHYFDTIETEITFKGSRADRREIRRNGRPWTQPFQALPGFQWYGGFGTELKPLFDPLCPTTLDFEARQQLRGKQLLKYTFKSPADACFAPFTVEYQRYNPARTGNVLLEESTGNVIHYYEEAAGFPADFDIAHRTEEVTWDYVKIGDASHLLPVGANFVIVYSNSSRFRIEVTYANHRHFESATHITFP
jgi:hypothetical protein